MTNEDPDILVQQFVDGELAEDDVKEALHRIADDSEARSLLQFELRMTQDLAARPVAPPPGNFSDRTMEAVADASTSKSASFAEKVQLWWDTATTPFVLKIRPVSAVATAVMASLVLVSLFTLREQQWTSSPGAATSQSPSSAQQASASSVQDGKSVQHSQTVQHGETVWIRFLYTNDTADSVAVAGDFSQWEPIPLSPRTANGKTVWTGLVPVSRGEHEYQFVINGERWVPDPLAPVKRSDGFGARNAVLKL
jgi:negative regulator of sigma E activity